VPEVLLEEEAAVLHPVLVRVWRYPAINQPGSFFAMMYGPISALRYPRISSVI
jgi:hypothetical protein